MAAGITMSVARDEATEERPLEILGISGVEERAYRWVLAHPGATVQALAQALTLTPGKTQRLLDTIESKGLATHSPERPRRYISAAPDIALKALIHRRQESLQRAEAAVEVLQEEAVNPRHGGQEQMLELITSREAERQTLNQMQRSAQYEFVALCRPPLLITNLDTTVRQTAQIQRDMQAKGVRYRSIVDKEQLNLPGIVQRIREDMKSGEDVRFVSSLPFKMVIVDHRVALIPMSLERVNSPVLLVRSSALLDGLCALFEVLWERAVPLSLARAGVPEIGGSEPSLPRDAEDFLTLMATGLNDKKIAHEMGLSLRTFYRHVSKLMKDMDAQTRFQFGWLAALRMSGLFGIEGKGEQAP